LLPTPEESRSILRLAGPIVAVQLGMMLMGVVDTAMIGRVSAAALGGVALGNVSFFGCVVTGMGTLMGLDPLVAQAVGARDQTGIARSVQRGLVLALALSLPAGGLLLVAESGLQLLGQPAEVTPFAGAYARWTAWSVFPFYVFVVLRQSLQALHLVRPILLCIVVANLLNVALNWLLIFGHLGFPALGVIGAAIATTIGRWLMALLLLWIAWAALRPTLRPLRRDALDIGALGRMVSLGLPIGIMSLLEYTAFGTVALLMGRLGTVPVAAHQVAINIASVTFMVPFGVGQAAAVLVGNAIGAGEMHRARRHASTSLFYGVGFMGLTATLFLLVPAAIAKLYTTDPPTLALAASLIPVAGVFQLFDGMQAVAAGILRGAGDTRVPMLVNLTGFWLAGMPVSLALGFRTALGPVGLWWGLAFGLAVVALILVARTRSLLRSDVGRVLVEEARPEAPSI